MQNTLRVHNLGSDNLTSLKMDFKRLQNYYSVLSLSKIFVLSLSPFFAALQKTNTKGKITINTIAHIFKIKIILSIITFRTKINVIYIHSKLNITFVKLGDVIFCLSN